MKSMRSIREVAGVQGGSIRRQGREQPKKRGDSDIGNGKKIFIFEIEDKVFSTSDASFIMIWVLVGF